jgi:hypothetical protein
MTMIEPAASAAGPGWTVISQVFRPMPGPGISSINGWRITAQLKAPPMTTFYVDVPDNQYPGGVRAALAAKAADVASVDALEA